MTTKQPGQVVLADIHFPDPPVGGFSYIVPEWIRELEPGCRVRVPFGNRTRMGIVSKVYSGDQREGLKNIESTIDESPLLPADVLALTRWIAEYYLCDWGEAAAAAFPAGLKSSGKPRFKLSPAGKAEPWIDSETGLTADLWRALAKGPLSMHQIKMRFPDGQALLEKFKRRGWVETTALETNDLEKTFEYSYLRTEQFLLELPKNPLSKSAVRQTALRDLFQSRPVLRAGEISALLPDAQDALRAFIKRGWLEKQRIETYQAGRGQEGIDETALQEPELSPPQKDIVDKLRQAISIGDYKPFLLHGVTGSGKTLVYLDVVAAALEAGKSVIVLVPEISLTPQLSGRLIRRFGELVGILHSGLQNRDRQKIWKLARSGKIRIVVGPRSAIFAPVENLGLIVVDEEHDDSYKQEAPAPRYHGKAAAFYRANFCKAVLLLGTATPDVVTYYHARQGRIRLLELSERHAGTPRPEVRVVMWGAVNSGSLFSPQLRDRLTERLDRNQQTILLVNRRGYATIILCPDCGATAKCPNCDVTLRYHRSDLKLECHYCGYRQKVIDHCPECRGNRLRYNGIGTQRVERELQLQFPSARIARLDLDTSRRSGGTTEILRGVAEQSVDILLGTQMVAKGHDFPNVTLVGILGGDLELLQSDFRAMERSFRLLVQASGRAGRSPAGGEVVIQCLNPTHQVFRWIQAADYRALFETEIGFRKPHDYPPFGRLVSVTFKSEVQEIAISAAVKYRNDLTSLLPDVSVLGPAAPGIERIEGLFRRRLIVKLPVHGGSEAAKIKKGIRTVSEKLSRLYGSEKLITTIDVDPVEV